METVDSGQPPRVIISVIVEEYLELNDDGATRAAADAMARRSHRRRVNSTQRHVTIRRLLAEHRVERQEQLQRLLSAEGVAVTQATLSRDLKRLGVARVADLEGYVYRLSDGESAVTASATLASVATDLQRGVLAAELSGNLIVIKTQSGHGNSVAEALDRLELPELAGTVAGDNTILAVIREGVAREQLRRTLEARAGPLGAWLGMIG